MKENKLPQPITAAVIGLGKIGQGLDFERKGEEAILTHASAYRAHPSFQLIAGVDPDPKKRRAFESKFDCKAFESMEEMYREGKKPEVVSLAIPTTLHFLEFEKIFSLSASSLPRGLLLEKPLALRLADAEKMLRIAREKKILLAVNYLRRFDPGVQKMKDLIQSGALGEIKKGVVWYSKGAFNNASHFIDLLDFLLGEGTEVKVLGSENSHYENDPEPDFSVTFGGKKKIPVFFLSADEKNFSMRDMELIGEKGALQYLRGGMQIRHFSVSDSDVFPGYRFLSDTSREIQTELPRAFWFVLENFAQTLENAEIPLASSGETALRTMKILERLQTLWRQ